MKNICVILSGSGISGYASIALVEFFAKYHIKPNQLIGCSTGAFIAAMWGQNISTKEMYLNIEKHYNLLLNKNLAALNTMSLLVSPHTKYNKNKALYDVKKLRNLLGNVFHEEKLENMSIPTLIQTTDIDEGTPHMLKNGLIEQAVYASGAMLPFYPAQHMENRWLADGSFTAPLPIGKALKGNFDVILVFIPETIYNSDTNSFMGFYSNFIQKAIKHLSATQNVINIYLQPEEVLIIPVMFGNNIMGETPDLSMLIKAARNEIDKREENILETILG